MKTTVSGTDDPGQRRVSQTAMSSEAKFDVCLSTTSNRHITYTTAQLHEKVMNIPEATNKKTVYCAYYNL